jgi:hypothetical protein
MFAEKENMKQGEIYYRSRTFWILGLKYIHLVRITAEQVVEHRNSIVAMWWGEKSSEEETAELAQQTNWSDARLVEPLLFNLFHGIELLLKGFALFEEDESPELNHKLTPLLQSFKDMYPEEAKLTAVFERYVNDAVMPELLRDFLNDNNATVDDYYQLLRYPFDFNFTKEHDHFKLKYKGAEGLPFYQELVTNLTDIAKKSVALGRRLKQDSEKEIGQVSSEDAPSEELST